MTTREHGGTFYDVDTDVLRAMASKARRILEELRSSEVIEGYSRPGNTQRHFDEAVAGGAPARGKLDGEEILVTRVEIEIVP